MGVTIIDQELISRLAEATGDADKPIHFYVGRLPDREGALSLVVQAGNTAIEYPMEWQTAAYIAISMEAHILKYLEESGDDNAANTLLRYRQELVERLRRQREALLCK